ncbi:hypothetical protein [Streptomyces sp. NPDC007172]|uniref:hypothetical protein n=1 Tax=Streptomyces sp. NPDC007172 TaxID=3364776 RepID=UPI00369A2769
MAERAWATAGRERESRPTALGRIRLMGAGLAVLAGVWAVLSCLAFTVWAPGEQAQYEDYRAAEPCAVGATAAEVAAKDCLVTWHFTVTETKAVHRGKTTSYRVSLKAEDDGSWQGSVWFGDSGPLFDELHRGDEVTATDWRRDIVVLSRNGVRQNTSAAPRDELQANIAVGVVAALFAAQSLAFGAVRLVRPAACAPFVWEPYGRWLVCANAGVGVVVGLASVWLGVPWWTVLVTLPAGVCAVLAYLVRRRRRTQAPPAGSAKSPKPAKS